MIRIGLPPPMLPRLRLRWHVTQTLFARHSRTLREGIDRHVETSRVWWHQVVVGFQTHWNPRARLLARRRAREQAPLAVTTDVATLPEPNPSAAIEAAWKERELLTAFAARYEDLVDLLCWAAKDGLHPHRDAQYAELRAWMLAHYDGLRPRLQAFWNPMGDASAMADPFEPLFASENVEDVLNAEGCIQWIMQSRCALETCCDSLPSIGS